MTAWPVQRLAELSVKVLKKDGGNFYLKRCHEATSESFIEDVHVKGFQRSPDFTVSS
jgi:hypothetical protein